MTTLFRSLRGHQITNTQTEADLDKETNRRVHTIQRHLQNSKDMNFWEFVINPDSFSQTVENVFHYAFLIRDGTAGVNVAKDGIPRIGNSELRQ